MNDLFKVLSDETRLRCVALIFNNKELCVCELMHALDMHQSTISRHLSIIKLNGLITKRKQGKWVLYSVSSNISKFQKNIIVMTVNELQDVAPYNEDMIRLEKMNGRPSKINERCCNV